MTATRSTPSPAEVLHRFHDTEVRFFASDGADRPDFSAVLDPGFVLHEAEALPYGGAWKGHEGFLRFLQEMNRNWSSMGPKEPPRLIEGDDTVVALVTLEARARATGILIHHPACQVARVRDGLVCEARMFHWDTTEVNRALGHEPA